MQDETILGASGGDDDLQIDRSYTIQVGSEELLPLRKIPDYLRQQTGERRGPHVSACYRWAQRGVRGLRLPTVRLGGRLYTSNHALTWWGKALTQASVDPVKGQIAPSPTDSIDETAVLRGAGLTDQTPLDSERQQTPRTGDRPRRKRS